MKVYIVSFGSAAASEENITRLFNQLPTRCIVLLEDIDSAGLSHTRENSKTGVHPAAFTSSSPGSSISSCTQGSLSAGSGRLSLSGLLNMLDGVASQEGRILIMTTNHIDKLDTALIRPGRIDMIVPFGYADRNMIASIFCAMYALYDNESELLNRRHQATDGNGNSNIETEKQTAAANEITPNLDTMVNDFVSQIPELEFTPAEIQGLLLRHKHQPEQAINAIEVWKAQIRTHRKVKEQKDLVNRFAFDEVSQSAWDIGQHKQR